MNIYRLPGKLPDEKIIKVLHRDYFVLLKKVLFFISLVILPLAAFSLILSIYPQILEGDVSYPLLMLAASAYYLFVWLFFFFSFVDYYLDIWIITNERIIDVRQKGFFSRVIAEQRLDRVQDVASEVHGFFPTIFKYGDVHAQTAGEFSKFNFQEIPRPEEVRDIIIKLSEARLSYRARPRRVRPRRVRPWRKNPTS